MVRQSECDLPRMSGRKVRAGVKRDHGLKSIPIVSTAAEAARDILRSYYPHANCYIAKPVDLRQFMRIVNDNCDFWLEGVKLPHPA